MTVDNASNNNTALEQLETLLGDDTLCFKVPCFAHIVNLVSKSTLSVLSQQVKKVSTSFLVFRMFIWRFMTCLWNYASLHNACSILEICLIHWNANQGLWLMIQEDQQQFHLLSPELLKHRHSMWQQDGIQLLRCLRPRFTWRRHLSSSFQSSDSLRRSLI